MPNYKPKKKAKELATYLYDKKRVRYNSINKAAAINFLKYSNYINVITPFKHISAVRKQNSDNPYELARNNDGSHIYDKDVEFKEYLDYFKLERDDYQDLYFAISKLELAFKSLVSYEFIDAYSITNSTNAAIAFNQIIGKINNLDLNSTGDSEAILHRKEKMKDSMNACIRKLEDKHKPSKIIKATDIYILLDRLGLADLNTIFMCLRMGRRNNIFEQMKDLNLNLDACDNEEFSKKIFNLVTIRNSVMHFNSMEILLKYSDYKEKIIRTNSSRLIYTSILESLRGIAKEYK